MQDLLEICCGLDVHKENIVACLLTGSTDVKPTSEIRTFSTMTHGLQELKAWLHECNCQHVAMESSGIYWIPVYETLESEARPMHLLVVNARHMKNVPGKKTDMRDSEWIATLLRAGLLRSSFIPEKRIRELRHLTRYRKNIVRDVTAQKNRIEKFLQSTGFRLSVFLSDTFGASGRNVMRHLIARGSINLEDLDRCLKGQTRRNINNILVSVNGTMSMHQQQFLAISLDHLEVLETHLNQVEQAIEEETQKFEAAMAILISIPGIQKIAASSLLAEIGTNMSCFPTAEHLSSWAGMSPGNNESAGKRKSASVNHGNPYVKSMLCEIAWVVAGKRDSYLSKWYWKLKQRKGAKKAIIALGRKLLVMIYAMLKKGALYDEGCFEQRRKQLENKRLSRMVSELSRLGYRLSSPALQ
jgi:transposase